MAYKLLKCKLLYYSCFLLFSLVTFSQHTLTGSVSNTLNEQLAFATVTTYNTATNKIANYTVTNEKGNYSLELKKGTYTIKVSFLGYNNYSVIKNITANEKLNIVLQASTTSLNEVIINSKITEAVVRKDTIKYNLAKITNGNEATLKDIIKKLPGVEIDENGKIKANGKKIDNLLIDGNPFFGDQHQLATNNINATMIDGIDLVNNYRDFSEIDSEKNTAKNAMNIKIKKKYKGKIKGNIFVGGGYKNKYELTTNLFSFRKKTNLYFIANTNNTGSEAFSFEDYISFQGGIKKIVANNSNTASISASKIPPYLLNQDNFKSKTTKFAALNFSYKPSTKLQLNSYTIFNKNKSVEEQLAQQRYFANNLSLDLRYTSTTNFSINNTFVNAIYKPSKTAVLEYALKYSPQQNNVNANNTISTSYFKEQENTNIHSIHQSLNYKQNIAGFYWNTTVHHSNNENRITDTISSNTPFLDLVFLQNNYKAIQNRRAISTTNGIQTSLSKKIAATTFLKASYNFIAKNDSFNSSIINNNLDNAITLNTKENLASISLYQQKNRGFNYNIAASYSLLNTNASIRYNFLPSISLNYRFKKSHYITLSYFKNVEIPEAKLLGTNPYILNFNTLATNQNITNISLINYNNYAFKYFLYDLFSGTLISAGANYGEGVNTIGANIVSSSNYTINKAVNTSNASMFNSHVLLDKTFDRIPFKLRLKNTFVFNKENNFVANV